MKVVARAPGKLVILGEYAVLVGGTALVMAVDRYAVATIDAAVGADCTLRTQTSSAAVWRFAPNDQSGVAIVDVVNARWPASVPQPWAASLDSRDLFEGGAKLGLGSSAAALCAWSGAWRAFNGASPPDAIELIGLHGASQGGGSGLDVAASYRGGVITYARDTSNRPMIGLAGLPDGVAFVAVSTRRAASTPVLVRQFAAWRAAEPRIAATVLDRLCGVAATGVAAALGNATSEFLAAVEEYSAALDELGRAMHAEILTAEHRAIAAAASRCGVAYKVSGAGGGDAGLAFAASPADLDAFRAAMPCDCDVLALAIDREGLTTQGRTK
jgi:phosphomevalonate kinase